MPLQSPSRQGLDFPQIIGQYLCLGVGIAIAIFFVRWLVRQNANHTDDQVDGDAEQELCTRCGYDVRGQLRCSECGSDTRAGHRERLAKLREDWPTESFALRLPQPHEQPVVILTTDHDMIARLLKEHLEARGIAAQLAESNQQYGAVYTAARTSYRLTVWSDDEERGRAILDHLWPAEARNALI